MVGWSPTAGHLRLQRCHRSVGSAPPCGGSSAGTAGTGGPELVGFSAPGLRARCRGAERWGATGADGGYKGVS